MKGKLSRLEARLQAIVEGSAAKLFPSAQQPKDLAVQLVEAMNNGVRALPYAAASAPNLYIVRAHPSEAQALQNNPGLLEALTQTLREAGAESNYSFATPPVIRVGEAPELPSGQWQVFAQHSQQDLPQTSDLDLDIPEEPESVPPGAFLIVDGVQTFPLQQAVVNIGRRQDNHLVIEDLRVSRSHAQLRAVRGRYVLFDLGSTGGTLVNGEAVRQTVLQPGDVISLSGVPLVYGQDTADGDPITDQLSDTSAMRTGAEPPEEIIDTSL